MEGEFKDVCSDALLDSAVRDFLNAKKDYAGIDVARKVKIRKLFHSGDYMLQMPCRGGMCKESVVTEYQLKLMTLVLQN